MTETTMRWPPPGLERMQGDLPTMAVRALLACVMLVLPVLVMVSSTNELTAVTSLVEVWLIVTLIAAAGLGLAFDTIVWIARTLRRTGRALDSGYDRTTVLRVLADGRRDMGFLVSGSRHFSELTEEQRESIAKARVIAALLAVAAGVWMLVALSIGLFAGAKGLMSLRGLQVFTLAPPALAYVVAMVTLVIQGGRIRRARKAWHKQPWSADLAGEEIEAWHAASGASRGKGSGRAVSRWGLVGGVVGVVLVLPMVTFIPATGVGPVLAAIVIPSFGATQAKVAATEAFRSYRLDPDESISPMEAGETLQRLLWGDPGREPNPGERPVVDPVGETWPDDLQEDANPLGISAVFWADSLGAIVERGLSSDQAAYLRMLDEHPLSAELSSLSRAPAVDVGGGRWQIPFPADMSAATVPIPRFGSVRNAAYAHIGAAILAQVEGREAEAERLLREVISAGFLLSDDGVTLIDNLIGAVVVGLGATALEGLHDVAGRSGDAEEIREAREIAERSLARMPARSSLRADRFVESVAEMVFDSTQVKGIRWEFFTMMTTIAPCLDLNRIVFGADDEYDQLVERMRASLVEHPSDEALFELARYGWVGRAEPEDPTLLGRLVATYMNTGQNSCGRYLLHFGAGDMALY